MHNNGHRKKSSFKVSFVISPGVNNLKVEIFDLITL